MTSKYAMNKTEAANYWKKSPNTIKKVIEENAIPACGKDARGNDIYECKDLAPYLVEQKKTRRRARSHISDTQRSEIEEFLEIFGSMKEFKEYEMGLAQRQKRQIEQKELLKSPEAVAMFSGLFAILKKKFRQIPTEAERICADWNGRHSERFDKKLAAMLKEVIRSAQEYADELQEHQAGD
ncbi:hypothetical protein ACI495_004439 [Vibrio vulnificus]